MSVAGRMGVFSSPIYLPSLILPGNDTFLF